MASEISRTKANITAPQVTDDIVAERVYWPEAITGPRDTTRGNLFIECDNRILHSHQFPGDAATTVILGDIADNGAVRDGHGTPETDDSPAIEVAPVICESTVSD